jgi:uncharacterized protein (UPF0333 family)
MKSKEQSGFALALVIIIIALIGAITFVLADGAKTLQFHSDVAYLQAIERNLTTSALAWARNNVQDTGSKDPDKTTELDVALIGTRGSNLTLITSKETNDRIEIQVNTSCSKGRQTFTNTARYQL